MEGLTVRKYRVLALGRRLQTQVYEIYKKGYLQAKFNVLPGQGCARSQAMCLSVACVRSIVGRCVQSHVTAQNSHDARREVMAARAMWDMQLVWRALDRGSCTQGQCARSWLLGSSTSALKRIIVHSIAYHVRSGALLGTKIPFLLNFTPLNHIFHQ